MQRKLNLILYLSSNWKEEYGGHLWLWSHDQHTNQPLKLEKEIPIGFNRALIFDTTQHSWHGISRMVKAPAGMYRKSLAIYYLCKPSEDAPQHARALYAPTEDQKTDESILDMIKKRADVNDSAKVYRTK